MTAGFRRGDQVTVLPPYDNDPLILAFQHYATVAAVVRSPDRGEPEYLIELDAIMPYGKTFGPFGTDRLAKGWRDQSGRWRIG